jgi:hypothetical protein
MIMQFERVQVLLPASGYFELLDENGLCSCFIQNTHQAIQF